MHSLYRAKLIYGPEQGPWRSIEEVELATLGWVHWYNTERIHGYLNDTPPAEFEDTYHAKEADRQLLGNK